MLRITKEPEAEELNNTSVIQILHKNSRARVIWSNLLETKKIPKYFFTME